MGGAQPTTIETATVAQLVQGAAGWFDVGTYTDVVFYTETASVTGALTRLLLETAPVPDPATFKTMTAPRLSPHTKFTSPVRFATAPVPLASWVRWSLEAAGACSVTFRVWMALTRTAR